MNEVPGFIELDRRFRKLDPRQTLEDAAFDSYTASLLGLNYGLGWKELLDVRLVVVLGEPGSGKTWELEERARILESTGQPAFFIRLDRLADEPLEAVLGAEKAHKFRAWQDRNVDGTFFLDSVDEAKFDKPSDFATALDRFKDALGSKGLMYSRILISSRISEWLPESDARLVRARFPGKPERQEPSPKASAKKNKADKGESPLVVQILPLDRTRVEKFAHGKGVADTRAFVAALDEHQAWEFARRPIDVADLINFWKTKDRLGSLTELIEHDLQRKLTEARESQDPLSEKLAREGAETLGVATALCRQFNFRVRDDAFVSDKAGLDAYACLPKEWRADQCRALLARPIFDGANYGHIRFHHRRVAEYSAAQWLAERMRVGCPSAVLEDLFFAQIGKGKMIRPALAAVAAWLANGDEPWNKDIRGWVLETAPWIHLKYADPSGLPLEYKRHILRALVTGFKNRERIWVEVDHEALARLADPRLADDVSALIRDKGVQIDVREIMLQLARHGSLTGCLDAALEIVAAPDEPKNLKSYAVVAIRDAGEMQHRRKLAEIANTLPTISSVMCGHLCVALYPAVMGTVGLAGALSKVENVPRSGGDLPYYLTSHLGKVLTTEDSGRVIALLVKLGRTPPFIAENGKPTPVSVRFYWVGRVLPTAIVSLLAKTALTPDESETAAEALWFLDHLRHSEDFPHEMPTNLDELTRGHLALRRRYFWRHIEETRSERKDEPSHWFQITRSESLHPNHNDLEWLLDDLRQQQSGADRGLMVQLTFSLWMDSGKPGEIKRRIRDALADDAALLQRFRKSVWNSHWFWLRRLWYRHAYDKLRYSHWWKLQWHRLRDAWKWLHGEWILLTHLRRLASGEAGGWLYLLVCEASHKRGDNHWPPSDWTGLQQYRGRLIAQATKKGCKRAWRRFTPLLPHEKEDPTKTAAGVIVGLAGLLSEFSDGELDLARLTEEDSKLATRYAVNELNGFPPWFQMLASHHPKAVSEVLSECIRGEWFYAADRENSYDVVHDLIYYGDGLMDLVRDSMIHQLRMGDPVNSNILQYVLTLLLASGSRLYPDLIELAPARVAKCAKGSRAQFLWLSTWLQLDAEPALRFILDVVRVEDGLAQFFEGLCSALSGEDREVHLVPTPDFLSPIYLHTLIPLIYRHMPPKAAVEVEDSGAHFLGPPDYAHRFRDTLLQMLAQSEDPDAERVLRELAEEPVLTSHRDWILHLADKNAALRANLFPWNPEDIRSFAIEYEIDPKTDYDLFKIACRRLDDIKRDVERAENSLRDEVHVDHDEIQLRCWLARKLGERSRNRYTVPQEEEIDQRQRPDIRLTNPKTYAVSVEVKWAENWPVHKILEGLESQLVGQYLRAHNSRYGIYVLGVITNKSWEHPVDKHLLNFNEVVELVEARAKEIVASRKDVREVAVIAIDFRSP